MAEPAKALNALGEHIQEQVSIFIIQEDRGASIAARGDVIDCAGKFQTYSGPQFPDSELRW